MKNLLRLFGILFLLSLSFMTTEKTVNVVKEYDDIMIELKDKEENYYVKPIEAIEKEDTIIPGIRGKRLDIDKSYSKMRRYGKFEESLIEQKDIYPKVRWEKGYEKYIIGGNPNKNTVSLIFLLEEKGTIDTILKELNKRNIKATFFITSKWLESNMKEVNLLVDSGYELGNLGYQEDYENYSFLWIDNTIKKLSNQENLYCYVDKKNKKILNSCKTHKHYTIFPQIVISENYYSNIKKQILPGSFIALKVNKELEEKLPFVIQYILSKGYKIDILKNHLEE